MSTPSCDSGRDFPAGGSLIHFARVLALAFVMGGALLVMVVAWAIQRRMGSPVAVSRFELPATNRIDARLAIGALIFGAGWGIGGLCPGPALADLAIAPVQAAMFVAAMFAGMAIHRFTDR